MRHRFTVSPGLVIELANTAQQEDLVVHRESKEHAEEENRNPRLHYRCLIEPEQPGEMPTLENQHQHAIGRPDRQQIHHDRRGRNDHRPERHHQQQEAQSEHEEENARRPGIGRVDEVDVPGRLPRNVDRPHFTRERRRNRVAPQMPNHVIRRFVIGRCAERRLNVRQIASFVPDHRAHCRHSRLAGQQPGQLFDSSLGLRVLRRIDHEIDRRQPTGGELPLQHGECVLDIALRERFHTGKPGLHAEEGYRERQQHSRAQHQRRPRTCHHQMRRPPPEAMRLLDLFVVDHLGMVHGVIVAPARPVDPVAQQADHSRNQGQHRHHRHHHRQDRAQPETAEDRIRHQEEPDKGKDHSQP